MKKLSFPVMEVKMVDINKVVANDYNPNHVNPPEFKLLCLSMEEDGMTQPCVVFYDKENDLYIVIDGFHRYKACKEYFKVEQLPVVVIDKDLSQRMSSTIRHNRARGSHQVEKMSDMVVSLLKAGWDDAKIAKQLGMDADELIRLKQVCGIAEVFKGFDYNRAWE